MASIIQVARKFNDYYEKYRLKKGLSRMWKSYASGCTLKKLSSKQIDEIQAYWQPRVGKRVSTKWHQLLYSLTGDFKVEYEPFEVCTEVQNRLSPPLQQYLFDDKGLYRLLLSGYNIPDRIAECNKGIYYLPLTKGPVEVSFKEFLLHIQTISDCIIKPSVGTDGGNGVTSLDVKNGIVLSDNIKISEYILNFEKKYGKNYCIERKVKECDNLQCLNPSSCNTLRIHTFRNRKEQRVEYLSSYIRIGKQGQVVDNAYSGGFCAEINKDGFLNGSVTVYPYKRHTHTESGVNLIGYKINGFDIMVDTVLKAHSSLSQFDLIGWDVTMSKDGNVIIIEFNPNPDVRIEQVIFGTTCLKDKQDEVLKQVYGLI